MWPDNDETVTHVPEVTKLSSVHKGDDNRVTDVTGLNVDVPCIRGSRPATDMMPSHVQLCSNVVIGSQGASFSAHFCGHILLLCALNAFVYFVHVSVFITLEQQE